MLETAPTRLLKSRGSLNMVEAEIEEWDSDDDLEKGKEESKVFDRD